MLRNQLVEHRVIDERQGLVTNLASTSSRDVRDSNQESIGPHFNGRCSCKQVLSQPRELLVEFAVRPGLLSTNGVHVGTRIGPSQTGKRQRRLLADEGLAADIIEAHQIGTLRSLRPAPSLASVHRNAKVHIRFKPVRLSCWDLDSRSSVDAVKPPWMVLATSILHGVKDSRIRIDNQSTDHFVHHVTEQTALFTSKIQAKNLITLFG